MGDTRAGSPRPFGRVNARALAAADPGLSGFGLHMRRVSRLLLYQVK